MKFTPSRRLWCRAVTLSLGVLIAYQSRLAILRFGLVTPRFRQGHKAVRPAEISLGLGPPRTLHRRDCNSRSGVLDAS